MLWPGAQFESPVSSRYNPLPCHPCLAPADPYYTSSSNRGETVYPKRPPPHPHHSHYPHLQRQCESHGNCCSLRCLNLIRRWTLTFPGTWLQTPLRQNSHFRFQLPRFRYEPVRHATPEFTAPSRMLLTISPFTFNTDDRYTAAPKFASVDGF